MKMQFSIGVVAIAVGLAIAPVAVAADAAAHGAGLLATGQRGMAGRAVAPGYLGIDVHDVGDDQVSILRLKDTHGAVIVRVDHDGPAGKMGLRERDVVVQMNGVGIDGEEPLRRMLHEMSPGRTVTLTISREGQQTTMTGQMADRSQIERQAWEQHLTAPAGPQAPANALPSGEATNAGAIVAAPSPSSRYSKSFLGSLLTSPSYTGAMLEIMGPQLRDFFGVPSGVGLLVRSVENNSPAAMGGMRAGDVVLRANAKPVSTMSDWVRSMREAKGRVVTVTILRDRQEKTLMLTPDGKRRSQIDLPEAPDEGIRVARLADL